MTRQLLLEIRSMYAAKHRHSSAKILNREKKIGGHLHFSIVYV